MEPQLLFSPSVPSDIIPSDERLRTFLPSPPTSPLMISPVSPYQSPRSYRSPFQALSRSKPSPYSRQIDPYSTFLSQTSAGIQATSPSSTISSDDTSSPVENSLDVDLDGMSTFDSYGFPFVGGVGGGYGSEVYGVSQQPEDDRKQYQSSGYSAECEGISVASPYSLSTDLPFISGHLKQEHYEPNVSDIGSYAYGGVSTDHPAQHPYAYTSSPESPFADAAAYYSPPMSVSSSIPINTHPAYAFPSHGGASSASPAAQLSSLGCDPRSVSGSPPRVDASRIMSATAGISVSHDTSAIAASPPFFVPANAEPDAFESAFPDGDDEVMSDSGEEELDDENDSDYIDSIGRRRPRSLVVPSQADRLTALTTPVVGSSVRTRTASPRSSSRQSSSRSQRPSATIPVPVPNLTKKSRGRRVPTQPIVVLTSDGATRRMRTYTCRVPGCGKCFARGEHLKRHIRSIHTNEKRKH